MQIHTTAQMYKKKERSLFSGFGFPPFFPGVNPSKETSILFSWNDIYADDSTFTGREEFMIHFMSIVRCNIFQLYWSSKKLYIYIIYITKIEYKNLQLIDGDFQWYYTAPI